MKFSDLTPRRSPFSSSPLWSFPSDFDSDRFESDIDEFMRNLNADVDFSPDGDYGFRTFPSIDIRETPESYTVDAELPGLLAKDIDIEVVNNSLFIKGETGTEAAKENGYICCERARGAFSRKIPFDEEVNVENINAELKDGVLHVELKKKNIEIPQHKKIEIRQ
ncbi:MAG: Hsp20/alpha crystallin family protein [Bdellovibrio sp.]|nr:Hsp20/alpha crystallin family protein [Bdellovibrio sp.]